MAGNFAPAPPLPPIAHRLAPALIPAPAGFGAGAGTITFTGAPVGLAAGQGIGVGAGTLNFQGAPVQFSVGVVAGFNVSAGQIYYFGNTVGLGLTASASSPGQGTGGGVTGTPTTADNPPFAPALSELAIDAWERVGKSPGELTVQHLNSMRRSMNLVLTRWSNRGINLWRVGQNTITLKQGVATYTLPGNIIDVLDTYLSVQDGAAITTDIVLTPMGRDTFAAVPVKTQQGKPLMYWVDRTITPSVTFWPVPDQTYGLNYFAFQQVGDADPTGINTADLPYRFLEAFTAGVASHLAIKWAPERAQMLDAYAKECFVEASDNDREKVSLTLRGDFSGYFR